MYVCISTTKKASTQRTAAEANERERRIKQKRRELSRK